MMGCAERFAREFLPRFRAAVAQELSFMGLTQSEIAAKLKVTQAAVSQYLRNVRGKGSLEDGEMRERAKDVANTIAVRSVDSDELHSLFLLAFTSLPHRCLPSWFCEELRATLGRRGYRL